MIKKSKYLRVALLGNPNTGKTTLFNRLTGNSQYVGNWPGVTVEKKEGYIRNASFPVRLTDLPGVYSLSPFSSEEVVTRNYILDGNADILINILDATNLKRNLYLTTQILDLEVPTIIVLNMFDIVRKKGKVIDFCELEKILGVPVIPISASKNFGIDTLVDKISSFKESNNHIIFKYTSDIELKLNKISNLLNSKKVNFSNNRFILIKVLEFDPLIMSSLNLSIETIKQIDEIRGSQKEIKYEEMMTSLRYEKASMICKKCVSDISKIEKIKLSRKIDKIVTSKYLALPIFSVIIFTIFYLSFGPLGSFLQQLSELVINRGIENPVNMVLNQLNVNIILKGFTNAIVKGIGEVVSFMPQILLLLGLLSILEDSGYMARAAFVMDKIMSKIGLSGKAFVPLLMGFGCSVPAILSTRILKSENEKRLTIFLIPFMSCGAKIPVYLVFLSAFFPEHKAFMIFLIYILGIFFAILASFILKKFIKSNENSLIMELPDYKVPSIRNLYLHMWDQTKDFLEHVGGTILGSAIIVWFLQSFTLNFKFTEKNTESILAKVGSHISPVFDLCGFGNWKSSVSLITGLLSKEAIISTMSIVYNNNEKNLSEIIKQNFTYKNAFSMIIFILLYSPCIAALATVKKELGFKYTLNLIIFQILIAWVASALFYNVLSLFG